MARLCLPDRPQHIIHRQICFAGTEEFAAYAGWLGEYARKYEVAIHAWVFMTNHVHLLATPKTTDCISSLMQSLGRQYVRYFNPTYQRTGTLWEGRFRFCVVDAEDYLLIYQRHPDRCQAAKRHRLGDYGRGGHRQQPVETSVKNFVDWYRNYYGI
jgi:putative transposase